MTISDSATNITKSKLHRLPIRTYFRLCILMSATEILAACVQVAPLTPTLEASLTDTSILTDSPCSAPCWYGLELNKSTKAEISSTIKTLSFLEQNSVVESAIGWYPNIPTQAIGVDCRQPPNRQCVTFLVVSDTLKCIMLSPNYNLTIGQLVAHLGPPDYVGSPIGIEGDTSHCEVFLFWVHWQMRGITYGSSSIGNRLCEDVRSGKKLDSNLKVDVIDYELPEDLAVSPRGRDQPWPGFLEP